MLKFSSKPFIFHGFPLMEQALNLFRLAVEHLVRDVNKCPFVTGNLIKDNEFTALETLRIYHKLGKKPQGWFVTRLTVHYARIFETESTDTYTDIASLNTFKADIWFF